jgi:two-component system, cell cycle sensor histidine kinase and response regulator CckA
MPAPRVLVVDDEASNLRLAERILQGAGYVVSAAATGADALQEIDEQGGFDIYVLDVMMPSMRGTELADAIRQLEPRAKILYFTAYSHALFIGARLLKENEAFVQKPVSKQELLEAVSLLLFNDLKGPRDLTKSR